MTALDVLQCALALSAALAGMNCAGELQLRGGSDGNGANVPADGGGGGSASSSGGGAASSGGGAASSGGGAASSGGGAASSGGGAASSGGGTASSGGGTASSGGGAASSGGGGQLPPSANALPDVSGNPADLFIAPTGSDSTSCTRAAPCLTFNRAYRVAQPGQVIEVAAGSYGNQRIDDDPTKNSATAEVAIRPASGAAVVITDLLSFASNVHYKGFTVDLQAGGQPDVRGGKNVVVENMRATNFYVQGPTDNVIIRGGDYGPYASCGGGSQIKTLTAGGDDPDPAVQPHRTTVDGVRFHDYTVPSSCPAAHLDCLHVFFQSGLTIRNSTFLNCAHYGVLLGSNGPGASDNDLIENNFFGPAGVAGFALRGGTEEHFDGVTVRYNSGGSITPQTTQAALLNVRWYANVAEDLGACRAGIDYRNNLSPTGGCDASDVKAPTSFVDFAAGDLHLKPGAAAIGHGKPGDAPATDIDGQPRPASATSDCGADQLP